MSEMLVNSFKKLFTKGGAEIAAIFGIVIVANSLGYLPMNIALFYWYDWIFFCVVVLSLILAIINILSGVYQNMCKLASQIRWDREHYNGPITKVNPTIVDQAKDIAKVAIEVAAAKAEVKMSAAELENAEIRAKRAELEAALKKVGG